MHFHFFTSLIFAIIYFHVTKAQSQEEITQRINDVKNDVNVFLHNPVVQKAAKAHAGTKRMLNQSADMAKKVLTMMHLAADKIFRFSKCIRSVGTNALDNIEGKIVKYLQCDLKVIDSIEGTSEQWIRSFSETSTDILQKIKKSAKAYANCSAHMNMIKCTQETIKNIWTILTMIIKTLKDQLAKPGVQEIKEIMAGVYKCTVEKFKTTVAIQKELVEGVGGCLKNHLYNSPQKPPLNGIKHSELTE